MLVTLFTGLPSLVESVDSMVVNSYLVVGS